MNYTVRKASMGDLETLAEFAVTEAREAEGWELSRRDATEGARAGLEDSEVARYWIAEDGEGEPVGAVSVVREWSNWQAGHYWWIQSLYVAPVHRGRGVTTLLMREVQEAARRENALDIRLYVHSNNIRALRAYQKLGFELSDYKIFKKDI